MPARADQAFRQVLVTFAGTTTLATVPAGERWLVYAWQASTEAGGLATTCVVELATFVHLVFGLGAGPQVVSSTVRSVYVAGDVLRARVGGAGQACRLTLSIARLTV